MIYNRFVAFAFVVTSLGLCSGASAQTAKIVTPAGYQNVEGDTFANPAAVPTRIQFLIPASDFADLPESQHWITSFSFRSDASQLGDLSWSFANHQIWLSTTGKTPLTLADQFSANYGADLTMVQDGPIEFSFLSTGTPRAFADGPQFQTPFHYDPAQGNLLMELIQFDAPINRNRPRLDVVTSNAPGNTVLLNSDSATATRGTFLNVPAVLQFEFVPEPSGAVLTLMGMASSLTVLRRKRRLPRAGSSH